MIGFIGLGAIGTPMAKHVAQAFPTTVWNRTTAKATAFAAAHGATAAPDVASLVAACDIVITCLPVSSDVASVIASAGTAWHAGQLLVDCTSGDPAGSRANAATLATFGVGFVDAPVSGGVGGAEQGTLTVMLGGEEPWITRARAVVAPFAAKVVHVGPVGCGHALKAVNNALLALNVIAAGEGLAALVKLGVPAAQAVEVINASSGRSNVTENLIPERVLTGAWPRTFSLALLDKDVGVALDVLADAGVDSELYPALKQALAEARKALDPGADHVEAIRVIEQRSGTTIRR
ncbi:MAG: NAD(P)-dependent oxidoreductase [Gemmatimonadales bacterium]